jgi:hypothetical protein
MGNQQVPNMMTMAINILSSATVEDNLHVLRLQQEKLFQDTDAK